MPVIAHVSCLAIAFSSSGVFFSYFISYYFLFLSSFFLAVFSAQSGCFQWNVCFLSSTKLYFIFYCLELSSLSSCIFDMNSCFIDTVALFQLFVFKTLAICLPHIFIYFMETFFLVNILCLLFPPLFVFSYFLGLVLHRCSFFNEISFFWTRYWQEVCVE